MTEDEVLKIVGKSGGGGMFAFEDGEMWTVVGDRAMQMQKSYSQQRLERPLWAGEVEGLKKRQKVTVSVADQEQFDSGPFYFGASYENGTLDKVIASLTALRESIPEKFRKSARCGIDSASGYEGSHYAKIEVSYQRPETDEEWAERKANVARRHAYQTDLKRQQLARLKAELEPAKAEPSA